MRNLDAVFGDTDSDAMCDLGDYAQIPRWNASCLCNIVASKSSAVQGTDMDVYRL